MKEFFTSRLFTNCASLQHAAWFMFMVGVWLIPVISFTLELLIVVWYNCWNQKLAHIFWLEETGHSSIEKLQPIWIVSETDQTIRKRAQSTQVVPSQLLRSVCHYLGDIIKTLILTCYGNVFHSMALPIKCVTTASNVISVDDNRIGIVGRFVEFQNIYSRKNKFRKSNIRLLFIISRSSTRFVTSKLLPTITEFIKEVELLREPFRPSLNLQRWYSIYDAAF